MKKLILFISLPILLALLNVACYFIFLPPNSKEGLIKQYDFLPGEMIEVKRDFTQRRLLGKTEQGYLVQEFYMFYPLTASFIIKNNKDLAKGIYYYDGERGDRFDSVESVEGPITIYYQTKKVPWIITSTTGFKQLVSYMHYQWIKFWDKPYQQTLPIALQLNYKAGKREGKQTIFYKNGQRINEAYYHAGLLEGQSTTWNDLGNKLLEINFKKGLREGASYNWAPNGQILMYGEYKADEKQGLWIEWSLDGRLKRIAFYQDDILLTSIEHNQYIAGSTTKEKDIRECGVLNNKLIWLTNRNASLSFSVSNFKKDCSYPIATVYMHDNENELDFSLNAKSYNLESLLDEEVKHYYSVGQQAPHATKDPVTGLWTIRKIAGVMTGDSYWEQHNGKIKYFINCSSYGNLCTLKTNLEDYRAELRMTIFGDSPLPKWFFVKEKVTEFIYSQTKNN